MSCSPGGRRAMAGSLIVWLQCCALLSLSAWQVASASRATAAPAELAAAAAGGLSRYVSVTPVRALDTRVGLGAAQRSLSAGSTLDVALGAAGVPAEATAVVANVTLASAGGPGWAVLYPADRAVPDASNLNVDRVGQTVANTAIAPIGPGQRVRIYTTVQAHFILDVAGYFVPSESSASGRFVAVAPQRLVDTRGGIGHAADVVHHHEMFNVPVAGRGGVGSTASAAVLSITAVNARSPGWLHAFPPGGSASPGDTSNLNFAPGQTVANLAIVPVGDGGAISIYAEGETHVLIDVVGWFTGAGDPVGTTGLFVPFDPVRLHDSRGSGVVSGGATVFISAAPLAATAWEVQALALNLTVTEPHNRGFVTAFPGPPQVDVSNLNMDSGVTVPVGAITAVDWRAGGFRLYTSASAHLIADASGAFVRPRGDAAGLRCTLFLHAKAAREQATWTGPDGIRHSFPGGNRPGWNGAKQWLYYPQSEFDTARNILMEDLAAGRCQQVILQGFSNGSSFAAKLYCAGDTLGGRVIGIIIDDPVVDHAVLNCKAAPSVKAVLYWTGGIDIEDGFDCVAADWTCEGDTGIGITRYEAAMGISRTPSIHTSHLQYLDPPELARWW